MTTPDPQPTALPPSSPPFHFSLRTLLLLFVVLGSSLGVFSVWGIVVFGLVVGVASYLYNIKSAWPVVHLVLAVLCLTFVVGMLLPAITMQRGSGPASPPCKGHLHEIVGGLLRFEQANGCFPPAYIADKDGKPMHSWRVLILPYIDGDQLYKSYNFNEPWNSPNNRKLLASRPEVYACPDDPGASAPGSTQTSFVAVVGPNTAWAGGKPRKVGDFGKDFSSTIMLVEATNSGIDWTEPKDFSLETLGATAEGSDSQRLASNHHPKIDFYICDGVYVAMACGSIVFLPTTGRSNEDVRRALQIGGYADTVSEEAWRIARRVNWPNIAALAVWLLSVGTLLTCAVRSRKPRVVVPPPAC